MKSTNLESKIIRDSDWLTRINDLDTEQIDFFIEIYREKVSANRKSTKLLGSTFILAILAYFLLRNSLIEEISFMSLKITNAAIILRFVPLILSGLIFRISSGLKGSIKREALLDELYRNRYKELNDHPLFDYVLTTGKRWKREKIKRNKVMGCLIAPFTFFSGMVIFFLIFAFVPVIYFIVGESIWNALHLAKFDVLQIFITIISCALFSFSIHEIYIYLNDEYFLQKEKNKELKEK